MNKFNPTKKIILILFTAIQINPFTYAQEVKSESKSDTSITENKYHQDIIKRINIIQSGSDIHVIDDELTARKNIILKLVIKNMLDQRTIKRIESDKRKAIATFSVGTISIMGIVTYIFTQSPESGKEFLVTFLGTSLSLSALAYSTDQFQKLTLSLEEAKLKLKETENELLIVMKHLRIENNALKKRKLELNRLY